MTQMSKDPAIKLFGRTIPLHEARSNSTAVDLSSASSSGSERVLCKETKSTNKPLEETNQTQISCVSTNQENQEPTTNSNPQDNGSGSETPLKKPDKIIPCPRCNSMDTKFCYYNNYNVNQPRHFCKNCQRYWTAGGTMRNVPVGAGRRKNKHPTNPHFHRHVMMTSSSIDPVPVLSGTGPTSVLKFGTEEEKKSNEEQSSCTNSSNEGSNTGPSMVTGPGPGPNMQCYPGPGFMWAPAIPFPFMPAGSYWPGPWWTGFANGAMQPALPSSPSSNSSAGSVNGFSSLGKHPREPASQTEEKRSGNLWAPKTVRILDPDEAAKSSIWTTLGFNRDEKKSMFKSFNKGDEMDECKILDAGPVLHANPAALSRFQSFQERT